MIHDLSIVHPEVAYYLNLYGLCSELGCLPDVGGLLDQTEPIIRIFLAIQGAIGERQKMNMPN